MATTYQLISSTTLGSSTSTVTFSSIPATYSDLVLRVSARTDYGASRTGGQLTFNGDTGTNYDFGYIIQYNTVSIAGSVANLNNSYLNLEYLNGTGALANSFGITEVYISAYADTSVTGKPMYMHSGAVTNTATDAGMFLYGMNYNSSTAISSIAMKANSGNWVANSSFYLYGIKNS